MKNAEFHVDSNSLKKKGFYKKKLICIKSRDDRVVPLLVLWSKILSPLTFSG
jgi:hypothetical protein